MSDESIANKGVIADTHGLLRRFAEVIAKVIADTHKLIISDTDKFNYCLDLIYSQLSSSKSSPAE